MHIINNFIILSFKFTKLNKKNFFLHQIFRSLGSISILRYILLHKYNKFIFAIKYFIKMQYARKITTSTELNNCY